MEKVEKKYQNKNTGEIISQKELDKINEQEIKDFFLDVEIDEEPIFDFISDTYSSCQIYKLLLDDNGKQNIMEAFEKFSINRIKEDNLPPWGDWVPLN